VYLYIGKYPGGNMGDVMAQKILQGGREIRRKCERIRRKYK
jgi:hypothetical protein